MSDYGKLMVEKMVKMVQKSSSEVVTLETNGVNAEVIRKCLTWGVKVVKIKTVEGFEKANFELAQMADCLVVIEGGKRSGTILAAKSFLDVSKDVWAIPGRITDENSEATNFLIKNGARILLFDEGDVDEMGNYGNNEL